MFSQMTIFWTCFLPSLPNTMNNSLYLYSNGARSCRFGMPPEESKLQSTEEDISFYVIPEHFGPSVLANMPLKLSFYINAHNKIGTVCIIKCAFANIFKSLLPAHVFHFWFMVFCFSSVLKSTAALISFSAVRTSPHLTSLLTRFLNSFLIFPSNPIFLLTFCVHTYCGHFTCLNFISELKNFLGSLALLPFIFLSMFIFPCPDI